MNPKQVISFWMSAVVFFIVIIASGFAGIYGCSGVGLSGSSSINEPQEGVVYYISDHLGNTHMMVDSLGNVVHEETHYPYGVKRATKGDVVADYTYTGKEYDPETGLIYFGGRYYSPEMGRWITPDPLFLEKPETAVKKSLSSNLYAYVRNNPASMVDEYGDIEKWTFEIDHRMGVYDNITLQANSRTEAVFQKVVGGGLWGMVIAPIVLPAASVAAPIVKEAGLYLGTQAYSAQLAATTATATEASYIGGFAKAAATSVGYFAASHPEETIAFGKGVSLGLSGEDYLSPTNNPSEFIMGEVGQQAGSKLRETYFEFENLFEGNSFEK